MCKYIVSVLFPWLLNWGNYSVSIRWSLCGRVGCSDSSSTDLPRMTLVVRNHFFAECHKKTECHNLIFWLPAALYTTHIHCNRCSTKCVFLLMHRAGRSNSAEVFDFQPCDCGNKVGTAVKSITCLPDAKYSNHAPEPLPNKRLAEVLWTCPGPWDMTDLALFLDWVYFFLIFVFHAWKRWFDYEWTKKKLVNSIHK